MKLVRLLCTIKNVRAAVLVLLTTLLTFRGVGAQESVSLSLTGGTVSFPAPAASDFIAGTLASTGTYTFQVDHVSPAAGTFTSTVYLRSSSATLGSGKPVADLEWRRTDDTVWHALTTSDVAVESQGFNGGNQLNIWQNSIEFRVALKWSDTPPTSYESTLVYTVATSRP